MKKYSIIIKVCILCMLILSITGCASVGSISRNYTSSTSESPKISFNAKKNDVVKIKYDVTIKEGTLKVQVEDSDGNVIEDFEVNKSGNKEVHIDKDDEYWLSAVSEDFKGDFKINANK